MATVSSSPRITTVTLATEIAGPFDIGFRLFSTDLRVTVGIVEIDPSEYTLNATFADGFSDGATLTLDAARPAGTLVHIESLLVPDRALDYSNADQGLVRKMNIELGRLTSLMGDLTRDFAKSIRLNPGAAGGKAVIENGRVAVGNADGGIDPGPTVAAVEDAGANALSAAENAEATAADRAAIDTKFTVSTDTPSGGNEGDVWFQYET